MSFNAAAWLSEAKARPFQIKPAPLGTPSENQILVKNHAVAVNPIDYKTQRLAFHNIQYPVILGQDVAGEVVAVGPGVKTFKQGDRVIGIAAAFETKRLEAAAFQNHTILDTHLASKIPDSIPFEAAVVIPLGFSTASAGLFNPDFLSLQLPTWPAQKPTGKTLLVWGGASSVGCNAIQLAVAAGYEVIATASPKNFEMVRKLGASRVFDYRSPTTVADLVDVFTGKSLAGVYDAIGGPACVPIIDFLKQVTGSHFVATVVPGFPEAPECIQARHVYSLSIRSNDVGTSVWNKFLPQALKAGTYVPAPEPFIAGTGLECLQNAVDLLTNGVSARKLVVSL